MFFIKKPSKGKYVKAKTPATVRRQKAAIVSYYTKKREEEKTARNNKPKKP